MRKGASRSDMIDPKFYIGRRDTRWDPYPSQEPEQPIAHDWYGFWAKDIKGQWFKAPESYVLIRQISEQEAIDDPRHAFSK